jgi:hypothetical protein
MLNRFKLLNARPSASASPTDIWEVQEKKTNEEYIAKIFIEQVFNIEKNNFVEPTTSVLLNHEINVYQYLKEQLIEDRNVRNILRIIDTAEFDFEEAFKVIERSNIVKQKNLTSNQIVRNLLNNCRYMLFRPPGGRKAVTTSTTLNAPISEDEHIVNGLELFRVKFKSILTPVIRGGSLSSMLIKNEKTIPPWIFMRYMYVLFTTLSAMSDSGVNQNDLHFGNVLVDENFAGGPEFRKRYFLISPSEDALLIDNDLTLFIYDFDRAAIRGGKGKYTEQLNRVRRGGNCPEFHPKRDFLKILCLMYHFLNQTNFNSKYKKRFERIKNEIMDKLITSSVIRKAILLENGACWLQTAENDSIHCDAELLNSGMLEGGDIMNWCFRYCSWQKNVVRFKNDRLCPNEVKLINQFSSDLPNARLKEAIYHNTQFISEFETQKKNQILQKILNIILELRK